MNSEAQTAVRNAGWLMAQKGSNVLTGVLFAALVPRLMGPDTFGRYALITSITLWFALVSGISSAQTMSRFVPEFTAREDREGLQRFVGNLLALRLLNGTGAAALFLLVTALWFSELDRVAVWLATGSVFLRTGGKLIFALFLGLNQSARWGMGETVNRWASLTLLVPGAYFGGLRGACLALFLTELTVLALGVAWARPYLVWSRVRLDRRRLAPYLRFGLAFYSSNVLMTVAQHGGETLVRLVSGDYVQVGYFGLAFRIYLTAAVAIWQFTLAFGPLLTAWHAAGSTEQMTEWIERMLKWVAMGGTTAFFSVLLLGENLVPLALGEAFRPVAHHLLPLMLALLTYGLGSMARLLALVYHRPGAATQAAALHLAGFVALGVPLVAWGGSFAGCVAVLAGSALYAAFFTWRISGSVAYSVWSWGRPILLGAAFLPLAGLRAGVAANAALFALFVAGYLGLLLGLRVVSRTEIAALRRAIRI